MAFSRIGLSIDLVITFVWPKVGNEAFADCNEIMVIDVLEQMDPGTV